MKKRTCFNLETENYKGEKATLIKNMRFPWSDDTEPEINANPEVIQCKIIIYHP